MRLLLRTKYPRSICWWSPIRCAIRRRSTGPAGPRADGWARVLLYEGAAESVGGVQPRRLGRRWAASWRFSTGRSTHEPGLARRDGVAQHAARASERSGRRCCHAMAPYGMAAAILEREDGRAAPTPRTAPGDVHGYFGRATGDPVLLGSERQCLVMRRELFDRIGGFDAEQLPLHWNDVDFCLRIREAGDTGIYGLRTRSCARRWLDEARPLAPHQERRAASEYLRAALGQRHVARDPHHSPNLCASFGSARPCLATRRLRPWRDGPESTSPGAACRRPRAAGGPSRRRSWSRENRPLRAARGRGRRCGERHAVAGSGGALGDRYGARSLPAAARRHLRRRSLA